MLSSPVQSQQNLPSSPKISAPQHSSTNSAFSDDSAHQQDTLSTAQSVPSYTVSETKQTAESATPSTQRETITHSMITRAKTRITKPINKLRLTASKHPLTEEDFMEPTCYTTSSKNPKWRTTMDVQINALIRNGTYSLVKYEK